MHTRVTMIVLFALIVSACGGDGGATTTTAAAAPTTTAAGTDTTAPTGSLAETARGVAPRPAGDPHEYSLENAFGFEVDLPTAWTDRENGIWTWFDDSEVGRWVGGSTHIPTWETEWDLAGAFVAASSMQSVLDFSIDELLFLPWMDPDDCASVQRFDYVDERFTGAWDLYDDCEGSVFVVLGFTAADGSHVMYAQVTVVTDADYDVLDQIVSSFEINGSLEPIGS
jgi:hypothetical protein